MDFQSTFLQIIGYELCNTGGNCMVDVFNLSNGQSIGVTDECVVIFNGLDAGLHDEAGGDHGKVLVNLFDSNPDLIVDLNGSCIKHSGLNSFTLNDDTKYKVTNLMMLAHSNS
jgi:hypothetical protein